MLSAQFRREQTSQDHPLIHAKFRGSHGESTEGELSKRFLLVNLAHDGISQPVRIDFGFENNLLINSIKNIHNDVKLIRVEQLKRVEND